MDKNAKVSAEIEQYIVFNVLFMIKFEIHTTNNTEFSFSKKQQQHGSFPYEIGVVSVRP